MLSIDSGATRVFDNVWFVSSDLNSEQRTKTIAKVFREGDKLVVMELSDSFKVHGFDPGENDWLKKAYLSDEGS